MIYGKTKSTYFHHQNPAYFSFWDPDNKLPEFREMYVQSISESHSEGHDIVDVLADTFVCMTMGANPVKINIEGVVPTTKERDYRLNFLDIYNEYYRGTKLAERRILLYFIYLDSFFKMRLESINVFESSDLEDMTQINVKGIGFGFMKLMVGDDPEEPEAESDLIVKLFDDDDEVELVKTHA